MIFFSTIPQCFKRERLSFVREGGFYDQAIEQFRNGINRLIPVVWRLQKRCYSRLGVRLKKISSNS